MGGQSNKLYPRDLHKSLPRPQVSSTDASTPAKEDFGCDGIALDATEFNGIGTKHFIKGHKKTCVEEADMIPLI